MTYEELLDEADRNNIVTKEKNLISSDGRIKGNCIAIRKGLNSTKKNCVLAEELGHYYTTVGNIVELKNQSDIKQEHRARVWAYEKLIPISNIIKCFEANCQTSYDFASHLGVTEEFLKNTLTYYKQKYGLFVKHNNYIIYFEPYFSIVKIV